MQLRSAKTICHKGIKTGRLCVWQKKTCHKSTETQKIHVDSLLLFNFAYMHQWQTTSCAATFPLCLRVFVANK